MDHLRRNLRDAWRSLSRNPWFTAAAVATLALGLASTTVVFSLVHAVLLHPLPYRDPGRLVVMWQTDRKSDAPFVEVSIEEYEAWRDQAKSFAGTAAMTAANFRLNLSGGGDAVQLECASVSHTFFPLLGIRAALGRTFRPEEDRENGAPVILISHGLWVRQFGSDPATIGRSVLLDGTPATVIGVLPPEVALPHGVDLWATADPTVVGFRDLRIFKVLARLKPGVSIVQATAEMETVAAALERKNPEKPRHPCLRRPARARDLRRHAAGASLPLWRRRLRPSDRLRQRREPPARARRRTAARDGRPRGARGLAARACFSVADRKHGPLGGGSGVRSGARGGRRPGAGRLDPGRGPSPGHPLARFSGRRVRAGRIGPDGLSGRARPGAPALGGRRRRGDSGGNGTFVAGAARQPPAWRPGRGRSRPVPRAARERSAHGPELRAAGGTAAGLRPEELDLRPHQPRGNDLPGRREALGLLRAPAPEDRGAAGGFVRRARPSAPARGPRGLGLLVHDRGAERRRAVAQPGFQLRGRERSLLWHLADPAASGAAVRLLRPRRLAPRGGRVRVDGPAFLAGARPDWPAPAFRPFRREHALAHGRRRRGRRALPGVERRAPGHLRSIRALELSTNGPARAHDGGTVGRRARPARRGAGARPGTAAGEYHDDGARGAPGHGRHGLHVGPALLLRPGRDLARRGRNRRRDSGWAAGRRRELGIRMALGAGPREVAKLVLGHVLGLVAGGVVLGMALAVLATRGLASLLFEVRPGDPRTFVASAAVLVAVGLAAGFLPARRASRADPIRALRQD